MDMRFLKYIPTSQDRSTGIFGKANFELSLCELLALIQTGRTGIGSVKKIVYPFESLLHGLNLQ